MKTLDDLLAERAATEYQDKLGELLNPELWTKETRDTKMKEIRMLAENMAEQSGEFVKEMLDTMVNDKSVLYWKILQQFIAAEVEMLHNFRSDLDITSEEALNDLPVDYTWINAQIKSRYQEIGSLGASLDSEVTATEVDEL